MKKILLMIGLVLMITCAFENELKSSTGERNETFKIKRGVNLSHWLSQDFGWAPKYMYINENDIRFIDSIGYDHVRIPIDEQEMWDSTGVPIKEALPQVLRGTPVQGFYLLEMPRQHSTARMTDRRTKSPVCL